VVPSGEVQHGQRLAPVALTREQPVAQLVADRALAAAVLGEPRAHALLRDIGREPVRKSEFTFVPSPSNAACRDVAARDHLDDRAGRTCTRELPVARVVPGTAMIAPVP
jgi:hypothetical protein